MVFSSLPLSLLFPYSIKIEALINKSALHPRPRPRKIHVYCQYSPVLWVVLYIVYKHILYVDMEKMHIYAPAPGPAPVATPPIDALAPRVASPKMPWGRLINHGDALWVRRPVTEMPWLHVNPVRRCLGFWGISDALGISKASLLRARTRAIGELMSSELMN